jgi:hypothetical protein
VLARSCERARTSRLRRPAISARMSPSRKNTARPTRTGCRWPCRIQLRIARSERLKMAATSAVDSSRGRGSLDASSSPASGWRALPCGRTPSGEGAGLGGRGRRGVASPMHRGSARRDEAVQRRVCLVMGVRRAPRPARPSAEEIASLSSQQDGCCGAGQRASWQARPLGGVGHTLRPGLARGWFREVRGGRSGRINAVSDGPASGKPDAASQRNGDT